MSVYDRLSTSEKASLVRQWQRFVGLSMARVSDHGYEVSVHHARAQHAVRLAKAREAYLWAIEARWFEATWKAGSPPPVAKLPSGLLKDSDIDDVLWEQHPRNLFDAIEEASL